MADKAITKRPHLAAFRVKPTDAAGSGIGAVNGNLPTNNVYKNHTSKKRY
jgi:hypothetical protein